MIETLYGADGKDETRVKRAFGWVVTFRDFPAGSWQTVSAQDIIRGALTFFTKGRATFTLDGKPYPDRVPGILSVEHEGEDDGLEGMFTLRYVEPTTRVCIPRVFNRDQLPPVRQLRLKPGVQADVPAGTRLLVCLGRVQAGERTFGEEQTIHVVNDGVQLEALDSEVLALDFTHCPSPRR